jgi:LuxR family transcriptional regulator, maltose regulon positive regulatory protein
VTRLDKQSSGGALRKTERRRAAGLRPAARRDLVFRPVLSNLQVPRPRIRVVPRRGLVAALRRTSSPLVLVSAPAGYGKTLTLAQWTRAEKRPSAWLQIEKADNDVVVLLTYLALALEILSAVDSTVFDWLRESATPIKSRILPSLEASLAASAPFLLVLDDAHLLRSQACWEIVGFVIDHLPAGAQVAVGTREDPPLPLGRMRVSGLLEEFRAGELALDRDEAGQLLRLHGRPVEDETLDAVLSATEGWAAGVYLALLAGEGRAPREWLPQIRGDEREVAVYLINEVLERQPYRIQEFLLRTSILERFAAPLCRAVTGRTDAHLVLARLARENLFVVALDDQDEWYRYHHLFAECLRAQLARRLPDELDGLHRAAAEWHHEHGDTDQAVVHWLAAGDLEPAADVVAASCVHMIDLGQYGTACHYLAQFTDRQILGRPPLLLAAGWVYGVGAPHFANHRRCENLVQAAVSIPMDDGPSRDDSASLRSGQAQLRAFMAPDGVARMLVDAELSLSLEAGNPYRGWYLEACKLRGIALYLSGRADEAIAPLRVEETKGEYPTCTGGPGSEVVAYQSLIAADRGRWEEAVELEERAWRLAQCGAAEVEPYPSVLLARARVLARHDDPGLAEHLERVGRFLDEMPNLFEYEVILGAVVLGEIALGRGDLVAAERWSTRAHTALRHYPDAGMLGPRAERLRLALQERRFGESVTAAEQRVLDLLPTELSVNDIGARLFISRNTMKSHMRSLYAKLGVHTRAQAVARARELRLLRPEG